MAEYNGWSNYETWRINLEFASDYCDTLARDIEAGYAERFDSVADLATALDDALDNLIDDYAGNGFAANLARSFASNVNWQEIAEHYTDELTRENWSECEQCGETFPPALTTETATGNTLCFECADTDILN